jgi:hypothetical protein
MPSKEQPKLNLKVPKQKRSKSKKTKRCNDNKTNFVNQETQV